MNNHDFPTALAVKRYFERSTEVEPDIPASLSGGRITGICLTESHWKPTCLSWADVSLGNINGLIIGDSRIFCAKE